MSLMEGLMAAIGNEKIRTYGIVGDCDTALDREAEIFLDGEKVGKITQPMYSTLTDQSLAMVQLKPELAVPDIVLEVQGPNMSCSAVPHPLPFYDPDKRTAS
jgi:aminomethyltransferase